MIAYALIAVAAITSAAQDKPDFSGRWVLAAPASPGPDIASALSVRQTLVRTTIRGDPMEPFFKEIAIDREFESATRSETHSIGIVGGIVGGVVAGGRADDVRLMPRHTHHAVRWDGQSLVFENGSYTGEMPETGVWDERREIWSLDQDGRLRIVVTTRNAADGSRVVTLVYRRTIGVIEAPGIARRPAEPAVPNRSVAPAMPHMA